MPSVIVKVSPVLDLYLLWSTVTDCPTDHGSRACLASQLDLDSADRFERADRSGTSALWGSPLAYGWADERFVFRDEMSGDGRSGDGLLPRRHLIEATQRWMSDGDGACIADLLEPFDG